MKRLKYFSVFLFLFIVLPATKGRYVKKYRIPETSSECEGNGCQPKKQNIQVYIITNSDTRIQRTGEERKENLFDNKGMIYITKPKTEMEKMDPSFYKIKMGRRSYDLSKKNRRKLMAMMNKELNRQLLAKANDLRRNNVKTEYDFNELVA